MKRQVFLSTFSQDALNVIQKYGIGIEYNHFCISSALNPENIESVKLSMEKEAVQCGLIREGNAPLWEEKDEVQGNVIDPERAIVHGPFTELIPCAIDPMAVEYCKTRFQQAVQGTQDLGLNRLVLHTGYYPTIYFPEWHISQSISFWESFLEEVPEDFTILLENVFDPEPYLLLDIVKGVEDPRLQLCLDVGHANAVTKEGISVLDWIKELGPYLKHFHLHNNDGTGDQHRQVYDGSLDMEAVLAAIDDYCPPEATLTCESRECDESIAWLLEKIN